MCYNTHYNHTNQKLYVLVPVPVLTPEEDKRYQALKPEIEISKKALRAQLQDLEQTVRLQGDKIKRLYSKLEDLNNVRVGRRIFTALAVNCATVAAAFFAGRALFNAPFLKNQDIELRVIFTVLVSLFGLLPAAVGLCITPWVTFVPDINYKKRQPQNELHTELTSFHHNIGVIEQKHYQYSYLSNPKDALKFIDANSTKALHKKLGGSPEQIKASLQTACDNLQAQIRAHQARIQELDKPLSAKEQVTSALG